METKIQLSEDELELMQNSEWILTKNRIIEKVIKGFGALSVQMQHELLSGRPLLEDTIIRSSPKISRGEKYEGLPYVILDYPRIFEKEDILAIRTLYWWGNYCSITLHIKGRYHLILQGKISNSLPGLSAKNMYISISDQEWNHDVNSRHYTLITALNEQNLQRDLSYRDFVKLTAKVEFSQWDKMEKGLFEAFTAFCMLIEA
ncbi:MAG: hypothetical protein WKF97_09080 [Chitinophagaceae bacterium]